MGFADQAGDSTMATRTSRPVIRAQQEVNVSIDQAREWFLSLQDHPERYRFDTHQGVEFLQGTFGEVGTRFKTREKFGFLIIALQYELTEADADSFGFRLTSLPWFHIWGGFKIRQLDARRVLLSLEIGAARSLGRSFLTFYPIRAAVDEQLHREVAHIKQSMESTR
jgi:hypothetical protein